MTRKEIIDRNQGGSAPAARKLEGRVAIVTGSDSGMGRAIAEAFGQAGARVAVTYRSDADGGRETLQAIEAAGGQGVLHALDVRDEHSVAALFEAVERDLGTPDILVNNAGKNAPVALIADTTTEDFDDVVKTNLYGPFFCARAFVRRRTAVGGGGKIINITSVHEAIPSPRNGPYGAAKGGMLTFTRTLALEVAELRINVNAIAPGLFRTPMTMARTDDPKIRAEEMKNIPWHRPGDPAEIAPLALYLASDDADYVTGESFTIDGGLKLNWGQGA